MVAIMATTRFSKDQIREYREALGLNQGELAERIGVNRTAVCHWEKGIRQPSGPASKMLEALFENFGKKSHRRASA